MVILFFNYFEELFICLLNMLSAHTLLQVSFCYDKCAYTTRFSCIKTKVAILSIFAVRGGARPYDQRNNYFGDNNPSDMISFR